MTKMIESETQRESRERAKKALQMTCLFQHVSPAALETVTGRMEEVRFKPGQRLGAAQGEPQDALYVVTEGKVQRERRIPRSSDRRQIVDESAHGMGDAPAFNVKVTLQPGEHGSAAIVVRGPDVDGLLGSISRALYSSGLSVVQARCEDDERSTPEQAVVRDVFVVRARTGVAIDDKQAEKIRVAITDACAVAAMGSVRLHGTNSFGTLHCLGALPAFATTTAVTPGVAWRLSQEELMAAMRSPPESSGDFVVDVASGLCAEIFRMSESYAPTPLFDQPPKRVNVAAVSVAAAFESYYRSTMNTILNARLLGTSVPATFFSKHARPDPDARRVHQRLQDASTAPLRLVPRRGPGLHRLPPRLSPRFASGRAHDARLLHPRGLQRRPRQSGAFAAARGARRRAAHGARGHLRLGAQQPGRLLRGVRAARRGIVQVRAQRAGVHGRGRLRGLLFPRPAQPLHSQAHAAKRQVRRPLARPRRPRQGEPTPRGAAGAAGAVARDGARHLRPRRARHPDDADRRVLLPHQRHRQLPRSRRGLVAL
mmetsp:Transcript_1456/g.5201  ORF Transcript_1456/g.5201 Transcript_1456/m.5201 type:complete len:541 (+) Transcript_1456:121-1743(+)